MESLNFNGKRFRTAMTTENGEVNQSTIFHYFQEGNMVWADYAGGGIIKGHLIAVVDEMGCLDMRYHHINENYEMMTGICRSTPELMEDGRIRMIEEWEWTCKDYSKGHSIIKEIAEYKSEGE